MDTFGRYSAFGLNIHSEIPLPELEPSSFEPPEMVIRKEKNPETLHNPSHKGVLFQAKKNDLLLQIKDIASYRILNGNEIIIDPCDDVGEKDIRVFLLGSAMGALLHQRQIITLHASAVLAGNGKSILISGLSGAGKSSLAATMAVRGMKLISDDISAIDKQDGTYRIYKGITRLKLWKDVLSDLKIKHTPGDAVRLGLEKYFISDDWPAGPGSFPIDTVIILQTKNSPGFEYEEITGAEKMVVLNRQTYRKVFLTALETKDVMMQKVVELANNIRVVRVRRPLSPIQLNGLADFIQQEVLKTNNY